jgi:hypothetical protein
MGGGCRQWNDDGREATMLDSVWHRNKVLKPDVKIFFRTTVAQSKFIVFLQRRCGYS